MLGYLEEDEQLRILYAAAPRNTNENMLEIEDYIILKDIDLSEYFNQKDVENGICSNVVIDKQCNRIYMFKMMRWRYL